MISVSLVRRKRSFDARYPPKPPPTSRSAARYPRIHVTTPGAFALLSILYLALAIWQTTPLLDNDQHAVMGYLDAPVLSLWNTWWTRYAILDLHQNPYFTNYVMYPYGANLALHTYSLVTGLLTFLTVPLYGPILGFNIVVWAGFVATGLGGAYFARKELTVGWGPAAFAGVAMTFTANVGAHLTHGHYNLTTLWAIPWCFLAVGEAVRTKGWRWPALAGLFAGIQGLQDLFLASVLALAILLYLIGTMFWRAEQAWRSRLRQATVFLLVAAVTFLPEAVALWADRSDLASLNQDLSAANDFAPDLVGFFVPSYLNPFFDWLSQPIADRFHYADVPKEVYLGWTLITLSIAAIALRFDSKKVLRPFWIVGAVFFILAFGPYLHAFGTMSFAGIRQIPLPYAWFHGLPLIGLARTPGTYVVMVTFALAMIGGAALQNIRSRWRFAGEGLVVLAIILVSIESKTTIPLTGAVDRPTFDWLRAQGTATMLAVPSGIRDGRMGVGENQGFVQTDQIFHQQRLFGGFLARVPDQVMAAYNSDPVLAYFSDPSHAPRPSASTSLARLQDLQVSYVLVYDASYAADLRRYLTDGLHLSLLREEPRLWLFGVPKKSD